MHLIISNLLNELFLKPVTAYLHFNLLCKKQLPLYYSIVQVQGEKCEETTPPFQTHLVFSQTYLTVNHIKCITKYMSKQN